MLQILYIVCYVSVAVKLNKQVTPGNINITLGIKIRSDHRNVSSKVTKVLHMLKYRFLRI